MKQYLARFLPIFLIFFVSLLALASTLGLAVMAHKGATRVAVFASSQAWAQIEAAGLPVVRIALGGLLIVVDGAGLPEGLSRLRSGSPFVLDASLMPGCDGALPVTEEEVSS